MNHIYCTSPVCDYQGVTAEKPTGIPDSQSKCPQCKNPLFMRCECCGKRISLPSPTDVCDICSRFSVTDMKGKDCSKCGKNVDQTCMTDGICYWCQPQGGVPTTENADRLITLAGHLSEYLAHTNIERFDDPEGTPRKIEEQFYAITTFLTTQLIPKGKPDEPR